MALPPAMAAVHDVFHLSMLRKYIADPAHILKYPEVETTKDLKLRSVAWKDFRPQLEAVEKQEDTTGQDAVEGTNNR